MKTLSCVALRLLHFLPKYVMVTALLCLVTAAKGSEATAEFSKGVIDIGIVVSDAERTAQFLTNAIGFTEQKGFSVTPEMGKKIGLVDGYPVDVRVFALNDEEQSTRLKVLSFPKAGGKKADQTFIHSTQGFRYLTLYVNDMSRALERLKAAKVKTLGETPLDMGGGRYITVVRDPDDNFIELIGPMKTSK
jgi:catechol 2,3-dioxygenase-like lactoylglutathione lyase family enzyme